MQLETILVQCENTEAANIPQCDSGSVAEAVFARSFGAGLYPDPVSGYIASTA